MANEEPKLVGEFPGRQLYAVGNWLRFSAPAALDDPVKLWLLDDGSIDVHIGGDIHTNVDPDGTVNG